MHLKHFTLLAVAGFALSGVVAESKTVRRPVRHAVVPSPTAGVLAANAAAIREPEPGAYLNAVQVYSFVDGAIYRLFTAPDKVSDIVLQPQEQLIAISAGDTARWVIGDTISGSDGGKQVHILVKPYTAGLKTNLVVTTSRRTYHLELESTPRTAMAAISWRYPQEAVMTKSVETPPAVPARPAQMGISPEILRFGYAIKGAAVAWRPLRAFDDGSKTYIEFPSSIGQTELPPLYILGEGGAAELTNYRLQGRFYVVDRLFETAELRLGGKRQSVVKIARMGVGHD
jgi:type IV secretion system protein VirB9